MENKNKFNTLHEMLKRKDGSLIKVGEKKIFKEKIRKGDIFHYFFAGITSLETWDMDHKELMPEQFPVDQDVMLVVDEDSPSLFSVLGKLL